MKVLHLEAGRHFYGGAKQVAYIMQGLAEQGINNILVCPEKAEIINHVQAFATVIPIKYKHEVDLGVIFRLRRIIQQEKPDIIHLHSRRGADILGAIAAKLTHTPCVLSRRVDNIESPLLFHLKYRLYDKVIAISEGIGNVLIKQGLAKDKLHIVHSSINVDDYNKSYDKIAFRQTFDINGEQTLVIGVIAQLIQRKGHRYLLACLPDIIYKHPNIHVLFFGKGPQREALEQEVRTKQLTNFVTFTGFRDDLSQWFGCLDLLVHPADIEGLGVSLLQTGAAGVAMIGSNTGGIPEIIIHEKTGLLVEPGDITALKIAINDLLDHPQKRQRLAHAAQQHIQQNFSLQTMIQGNIHVYQEILNHPNH